jgi:hypothetical protein
MCAVSPAWVTSASARRQSPSAQNTVRSPGPAGSPASAAGVKPSQNRRVVSSDHGPRALNSATRAAIACSVRFTDTRTVADGTGTSIDRAGHLPASAPITPTGAAACLADPGRAVSRCVLGTPALTLHPVETR